MATMMRPRRINASATPTQPDRSIPVTGKDDDGGRETDAASMITTDEFVVVVDSEIVVVVDSGSVVVVTSGSVVVVDSGSVVVVDSSSVVVVDSCSVVVVEPPSIVVVDPCEQSTVVVLEPGTPHSLPSYELTQFSGLSCKSDRLASAIDEKPATIIKMPIERTPIWNSFFMIAPYL